MKAKLPGDLTGKYYFAYKNETINFPASELMKYNSGY